VFDGALLLGVCDKIVPGLLIGALHFGHLPCVFVPAGPMSTGLGNDAKSQVRERFAAGQATRDELLAAESAAYHGPGTCTFYGTANSNQMLLEAMGLHVPGAAFVHPHAGLREALTRAAVGTALAIGARGPRFTPIGRLVDERCIVNAMVALLATGGSTNHLIHWVAVARAAGILIDWTDFAELSAAVPLLARVYPNGSADVNAFQAAAPPSPPPRPPPARRACCANCSTAAACTPTWPPSPKAACAPTPPTPSSTPRAACTGLRLRPTAATNRSCGRRRGPSRRPAA
jgi:phosphogluconate dehydratase